MVSVRRRRVLVAGLLTGAALVLGYGPSEPEAPAAVGGELPAGGAPVRIDYGPAADTFGQLYLPTVGQGPFPVVVLVHGGGWSQYRNLGESAPQAVALAAHGVAVWNVEYRRVHGAGGWPTTLHDVRDAVNALAGPVRERVGDTLDLHRVHLAGHSAGGHLAAWVAAQPLDPELKVRSATLMAAVLDLDFAARNGRDRFVRGLLGGAPEEVPERYHLASPIEHLAVGVALTAVHGDADRVVSPEQSRRYITAAQRAGRRTELHILRGSGHADFLDTTSLAWQTAQAAILGHAATLR
ncbi:alpha/beta hydrolase family protein [Nocardia asteroides]|uniref:alpha/beta hydrolase family protein n=1 Tax=Nocardia asteroides TaxID=1824 RepID=UPI001E5E3B52|nr:alpha/beta fold hydrolase [Nocardia asteroides]UGT61604.1 alpha/beta fold hydrolase [Nocardia asteroides]